MENWYHILIMMWTKTSFLSRDVPKTDIWSRLEKITNIGKIKLDGGTHILNIHVTKYTWAGGGISTNSVSTLFPEYQNISFIQALTYRKFCKALWVDFGYWIHCLLDVVTLDYHRHGHVCQHVSLEGHHVSSEVFLTLLNHVSLKWLHWRRAETNFSCGYCAPGSEAAAGRWHRLWWPRSSAGGVGTSLGGHRGQSLEAGDVGDGHDDLLHCHHCPLTADCSSAGSRRSWSSWCHRLHRSDRQLWPRGLTSADDTLVTLRLQWKKAARAQEDTTWKQGSL